MTCALRTRSNMFCTKNVLTLISVFILFIKPFCIATQCKDEEGKPTDWFYIYKLPMQANHVNPLIQRGVAYMYMTASNPSSGWIMSQKSIGDRSSMPGLTLQPLYENSDLISIIYNDQPPIVSNENEKENIQDNFSYESVIPLVQNISSVKYNEECGHTKGAVIGDKDTALWLVHSVPKFPPPPAGNAKYEYPHSGTRYGQTFLCMSLKTKTLNDVGMQLQYNQPQIISSFIPRELSSLIPNLVDAAHNVSRNISPWYHTATISTLGNFKFVSFAKSARFGEDLYSGLVAPNLHIGLQVETWSNGPGILPSSCNNTYHVKNVVSVKAAAANVSFTSHHDHSKWAVAYPGEGWWRRMTKLTASGNYWICVGDINRAISQESRGGGTVCTKNKTLWRSFTQLVDSVQGCDN